jgi:hypothetical protein
MKSQTFPLRDLNTTKTKGWVEQEEQIVFFLQIFQANNRQSSNAGRTESC